MGTPVRLIWCAIFTWLTFGPAVWAQAPERTWEAPEGVTLPQEVIELLDGVEKACLEVDEEGLTQPSDWNRPALQAVDLAGDGSKDLIVDAGRLCRLQIKGNGACSTWGCRITIWKQQKNGSYRNVFEHPVELLGMGNNAAGQRPFLIVKAMHKDREICKPTVEYGMCILMGRWGPNGLSWQQLK